jgi:hypothetical protein
MHPATSDCIAELDGWIRTTSRYDMFLAPDRRVLNARVDDGRGLFSGSNGSQPVELTVTQSTCASPGVQSGVSREFAV